MAENARNFPSPVHFCMQFYAQLSIPSSDSPFGIPDAFSSFISQPFNAAFSTLGCYLSYFARLQFILYFNQSITFIIPVLTTLLQLSNKSPFATHPRAMRVAVSSSVVYYLAYMVLLRFPLRRFAVIAHHCLVSSGYASVASLASALLPDSFGPFVYAVFVLLSASELLHWLYDSFAEEDDAEFPAFGRRVPRFLNDIRSRFVGNSSGQQMLPV